MTKNLHYAGNSNSDTLFIMVHGGPGAGFAQMRSMEGVRNIEKYYYFVYYDQCTVGFNQKKITKKQLIDELNEVIDRVALEFSNKKIVLFAASFGCLISLLDIEREQTSKGLSGFVMCSPFVYKNKEEGRNKFNLMVNEFVGNNLLKKFVSRFVSLENFDSAPLNLLYKSLGKRGYQPRHIAQVSNWMYEQNLTNCVKNKKTPILIIQGEYDKFSQKSDIDMYLDDGDLDIFYKKISESGHDVPNDNPQDFESVIRWFVDKKIQLPGENT